MRLSGRNPGHNKIVRENPRKPEHNVLKVELRTNRGIHGVSDSVCEGINKKAQDTRRQAYGYRNVQNFFQIILLRQGDLVFRF